MFVFFSPLFCLPVLLPSLLLTFFAPLLLLLLVASFLLALFVAPVLCFLLGRPFWCFLIVAPFLLIPCRCSLCLLLFLSSCSYFIVHERRTTAVRTQEQVLGCGGEMLMLRPWSCACTCGADLRTAERSLHSALRRLGCVRTRLVLTRQGGEEERTGKGRCGGGA